MIPRCLQLAVALFASLAILTAAEAPRPNIVIFLADDLGWADVPWHGSTDHLPNINRLAREGVKLEAHYVHPMCSPTRAALLSGRYASRFGVTAAQNQRAFPFDTPTLASGLRSAGYDTALIGKWHLGSKTEWGPQKFGFDFSYGSLAGGVGPLNHRYKEGEFSVTWHRNGKLVEEDGHVTDLLAREAVQWIDQRGQKPFFLYVPFTAIHVPIVEEEKWQQANKHHTDPAKRLRAACSTHMDDAIGQVLAALDRKKLRENTLVLFLSDNGAHAPQANQGGAYPGDYGSLKVGNNNLPLRDHKTTVYEGGIRTPGVANWPGKLKPAELHQPLHAVDWLPTLFRLAGVKALPGKLDGLDIWSQLAAPSTKTEPRTIYSAGTRFRTAALRHGDWKLVITKAEGKKEAKEELFNLAEDIGESKNLAAEKPEILADLKRKLDLISKNDNDSVVKE
ncbi:MAG: sulfatase-like hydrolase/transferase [Verrucomicrobiota bacterium]